MMTIYHFLTLFSLFSSQLFVNAAKMSVSFDGRSFFINDERALLISGSFHYPRAPRSEWNTILKEALYNGINIIQTYVFWDLHEPTNNEWNFPSSPSSTADLVAFVQEAAKVGLYVNLRISGYICAEWNFGGMPVWLRGINGTLRTFDDAWLVELKEFVGKTVEVVKSAGLLAPDGGPIVMMQIENEYGNMEDNYGDDGHKYVQHIAEYALSLDVGVPWIMCQQGEGVGTAPPAEVINTCNGFYCDKWIAQHAVDFPNQPHMFTENWPGWFQNWGEPIPHRPAVDVAFSVARWFALGGSYMNYYMAFGGSNFGRSVGGPLIVTSYDYDVQINEYAMRAEPKYTHLQRLHSTLLEAAPTLLSQDPPTAIPLPGSHSCEMHAYRNINSKTNIEQCLTFLSNEGMRGSCAFAIPGVPEKVIVPAWSVSILAGINCTEVVFNTKTSIETAAPANVQTASAVHDLKLSSIQSIPEKVPSSLLETGGAVPRVASLYPLEQLSVTADKTDYLWYTAEVPAAWKQQQQQQQRSASASASASASGVKADAARNALLEFRAGSGGGAVMFIYVDSVLVGSTLGPAGGPPVKVSQLAAAASLQRIFRSANTLASLKNSAAGAQKSLNEDVAPHLTVEALAAAVAILKDDRSMPVSLNISIPTTAKSIDILSVSMGLQNYGPFLEDIEVGIVSNVTLDGELLMNFTHSIGLQGEFNDIPHTPAGQRVAVATTESCLGLCWHVASFPTPASLHSTSTMPQPLALDLGISMGKGAAWVNGNMLGRYWSINATATATQFSCRDTCDSSEYVGLYWGDRCRTGCGEPSQSYYKLPSEWLKNSASGEENTLVLFEETGGVPAEVKLVRISMTEATAAS